MSPSIKRKAGPARIDELAGAEAPPTLTSQFANLNASAHAAATPDEPDTASADDVMDLGGVVRILRVGRDKIYEMVARNEFPHRRFGRRIRFSRVGGL